MRFLFLFVLMALGLASPALAVDKKPDLYVCKITKGISHTNWISESTAFIVYSDTQVKVLDDAIMYFFKEAQDVKSKRRGQELRLNWSLGGMVDSKNTRVPQFRYNAKLNTKTLAVSISARPLGFENRYFGQGTCVKRKK